MARRALLALSCLAIALATGLAGCTWTETRDDFPPSLRETSGHGHDHGHVHGGH